MNIRKTLASTALLLTIILAIVLSIVPSASTIRSQTTPAAFGLKIINHEELFKVINEALKTQPSVEIETRRFFEFQGIMAEVIFCDPAELPEKPLGDVDPTNSFGIKVLNGEEFFKAIGEAAKNQPLEHGVEISMKTFFEFQGVMAEVLFCDPAELPEKSIEAIEPTQRPYKYPISGTVRPGRYRYHGPYGAAISIEIDVSWTPTDQACLVGIIDTQTGEGPAELLYGGSSHVGWSTNPNTSYYVIVASPQPPNTKTITYDGQVTVWRLT
ncbi:MAG: hypothetical protein QXZ25_04245 [Candidatus Bathyarchaeia archaeon]